MFGNVIGQENVIKLLKNDVVKKSLSNSIIFYGEHSNGKLTTAFELVRVLNCKYNGESSCQCSNCTRIKTLDFEGFIFLSRRDFTYYLCEYINSYKQTQDQKYIEKIRRIIKLIFLPLQDFLVKECFSESDKKFIGEQSENIQKIISKDEFNSSDLEDIQKINSNILELYKKPNIPVDSIRGMLEWTYITQPDINRVVIIDKVDLLEESSRNILLKRLEEPAPNLFFILIAENKNRIIETVRSRCRSYFFNKLKTEDVVAILKNEFAEETIYNSVNDFLTRTNQYSQANIYPIVIKLINYVLVKEHSFFELTTFINGFQDRKQVKAILHNLKTTIEKEMLQRQISYDSEPEIKSLRNISNINLNYIAKLIKDRYNKIETFNLNPILVLEGIFYPIKTMVQNDQI